jgi:peptide/nickel transport system substrate-binding protein
VGIDIKIDNLSSTAYYDDLFNGKFDLAYGGLQTAAGPSPYFELRNTMHSATTAPIGQPAGGDYGRYSNPAVDSLLDQFGGTTDAAQQHTLMKQIADVMLQDVPVIPVTEGVSWYQYSTKDFGGWPTPQDQYAAPAPWNLPDWEQVLLRVHKLS